MNLLPRPILPIAGESMAGYITRLAISNMRFSPQELLRDTGWKHNWTSDKHKGDLLKHLANLVGEDSAELATSMSGSNFAGLGRLENRSYKNLELSQPRACAGCMVTEPVHRGEWQFAPVAYCAEHRCKLIDSCPSCGKTFGWNRPLLQKGCGHCPQTWDMIYPQTLCDTPAYYSAFTSLDSIELQRTWIHDILLAAQRVLRPFDSVVEERERPPSGIQNWNSLMSSAYMLLSNTSVYERWIAALTTARRDCTRMGSIAVYLPLTALQRAVRLDWRIKSAVGMAQEAPESVVMLNGGAVWLDALPSRTRNCIQANIDIDLRYQVDLHELASCLGMNSDDLSPLVENGSIESQNGARILRDAYFDLRMIFPAENMRVFEADDRYSPFETLEYLLPLFAVKRRTVIAALFAGKLRYSLAPGRKFLLQSVHIHRGDLLRFLARTLMNQTEKTLSMIEVTGVLKMTDNDVRALVKNNYLEPMPWQRQGLGFRCGQVLSLIDQYLVLSRWCQLRGYTLKQARQMGNSLPNSPICGKYLYKKTNIPKLKEMLDQ